MGYTAVTMVYRFWRRYEALFACLRAQTVPPSSIVLAHHATDPPPKSFDGATLVCVDCDLADKGAYQEACRPFLRDDFVLLVDADTLLSVDACEKTLRCAEKRPGTWHSAARRNAPIPLVEGFLAFGYTPARFDALWDASPAVTKTAYFCYGYFHMLAREALDKCGGFSRTERWAYTGLSSDSVLVGKYRDNKIKLCKHDADVRILHMDHPRIRGYQHVHGLDL